METIMKVRVRVKVSNIVNGSENRKEKMEMRNGERTDLSEPGGELKVQRGERMS